MPGRNVTALSALRVAVGIRFNWSAFSVADTVAVCVLISSELLDTLTVSEICPTSSTIFAVTGVFGENADLADRRLEARSASTVIV